jgi:hypothetical protein
MLKSVLFTISLIFLLLLKGHCSFLKFYGTGNFRGSVLTRDSAIVAVGSGFSIIKTDLNGDTIWTRNYPDWTGPGSVNEAISVCETAEGEYLIGGYTGNLSLMYQRLIKVGNNGDLLWAKLFSEGYIQSTVINNKGLYIVGFNDYISVDSFHVNELDTSGNIIWDKAFYLEASDLTDTKILPDDRIIISGMHSSASHEVISFIMSLDSTGNIVDSSFYYTPPYGNNILSIDLMGDSVILACGAYFDGWTNKLCRISKLSISGDTISTTIIPYFFSAQCIQYNNNDNSIIVCGSGWDSTQTNSDVYLLILDTGLNLLSTTIIDSSATDHSFSFVRHENQIYVTGFSTDSLGYERKWIILIDTSTLLIVNKIENVNYMYYSDPLLNIIGEIEGSLLIYNQKGALVEIKTLTKNHSDSIDLSNLESGYYLAVLSDNKGNIPHVLKLYKP